MATTTAPVSLHHHFADRIDPRSERSRQPELLDIIGIAICAVVSGAESGTAIEAYGRAKRDWLARFFGLPHGIPAQDTFRSVFCLLELEPAAFQRSFAAGSAALADCGVGSRRTLPSDGQTARRSGRRGRGRAPLHLVSAWAGAHHVTLGEVAVDDQSHEITALPRRLEWLDRSGAWVTLDAMGCQKARAAQRVADSGDYILAVQDHQPHWDQDIQDGFTAALETDFAGWESSVARPEEPTRGRDELRECHVIARPAGVRDVGLWKGLTALCMVLCRRVVEGVERVEFRYSIGSFVGTAVEYLGAIRGHWGIENSLHWVLDVVFREDDSRHHAGHSGENLALLRRLAISLLEAGHQSAEARKDVRLQPQDQAAALWLG